MADTAAEPTPGPYHVHRNHAKGSPPEHDTFSVLAPNPDAGKEGVPYSGEHLSVAQQMDDEAAAHLFAASYELNAAALKLLAMFGETPARELALQIAEDPSTLTECVALARAAVAKADERTAPIED
jgi:hypothetical protein